jgi:hypothetical protein
MAVDTNKNHFVIAYQSDDGSQYALQTTRNHAASVSATAPNASAPPFPLRWKPRKVHGIIVKAGRDQKISIVVPDPTSALWTQHGGTINVTPYGSFRITGRTGEARTQGAKDFDGQQSPESEFVRINYRSSDGNDYALTVSRRHAFAAGATAPAAGAKGYPKRWTARHWVAISTNLTGTDQHATIIAPDPTAQAWTQDGAYSFNMGALGTFVSTGRVNEKRPEPAPPYAP